MGGSMDAVDRPSTGSLERMSVASPEPSHVSIRLPRPLWLGLATLVMVVVATGLRFGIPVWRQQAAVSAIEALGGSVQIEPGGPAWLRDRIGIENMKFFDRVVMANLHD